MVRKYSVTMSKTAHLFDSLNETLQIEDLNDPKDDQDKSSEIIS